ncbi:hypothetical protein QW180_21855 [Vibrio sinaloensis]|nr:hypothetical protein [Vibrio sinaloensis]
MEHKNYNFFLVEQLTAELRAAVNEPLNLVGKKGQNLVAKVIEDDRPFSSSALVGYLSCLFNQRGISQ